MGQNVFANFAFLGSFENADGGGHDSTGLSAFAIGGGFRAGVGGGHRACLAVRDAFGARLTLVNVVEYVPPGTEYAGGAFVAEPVLPEEFQLEQELIDVAVKELDVLGERSALPRRPYR
jgi:hypothetical protein